MKITFDTVAMYDEKTNCIKFAGRYIDAGKSLRTPSLGVIMVIRAVMSAALALFLGVGAAQAADCEPLTLANTVQMIRLPTGQDFLPVTINGTEVKFFFDTGGYVTQIGRTVAEELKLTIHSGPFELYDIKGDISHDQATIADFTIGNLHDRDVDFPVSPIPINGGILSLNYLESYDIDVDFGTDRLNFFSPGHCLDTVPADVDAKTGVPMAIREEHIIVPVIVEGQQFDAIIDTGAAYSSLRMDLAQSNFRLAMGAVGTPEDGVLNGDPSLKTYSHVFKNLTLGNMSIGNASLRIIPDLLPGKLAQQHIVGPALIIGMDILRKLHIYLAFKGRKIYLSPTLVRSP